MTRQRNQNYILQELQMITGIISEDLDYIVYLLLKSGSYFQKQNSEKYVIPNESVSIIKNLDEWFANLCE